MAEQVDNLSVDRRLGRASCGDSKPFIISGRHPMADSTRLAATATAIDASYQAGDVADPLTLGRLRGQLRSSGLAVFNGTHDAEGMITLAGQLMRVTAHPDSDDRGVTTITAFSGASERPNTGGFSRRELLAHTDGSGVPRSEER